MEKKREQFNQLKEEFIQNPEIYKGKWSECFTRNAPLHIELGMGRGQFISTTASLHPNINYIGIEKFPAVILRALEKKLQKQATNLELICGDADLILSFFAKHEVDRIYLNFSDPWPKKKHAEKRLTAHPFLNKYRHILKSGGEIHFKTDNQKLFEFSLHSLSNEGWQLRNITLDLHNSPFQADNIMTEYEERYVKQGLPIYRLEASIDF